ncbi:MAG: hypothetical protein HKP01_09590 [Gemmatimonadetes bacterium]|nr:hypothetical protein [Gemmatimonadota bacterium]
MARMMLMLVGLLALALWPTDLVAQRRAPSGPAASTDSIIDSYKSRLNLNDEQATAIRQILEAQRQKGQEMFEAVRGQGREAMREMRPKMEQLQTETSEQIEGVLEEDQLPEYREIQGQIREQRRSRQGQRQPGG